MVRIRGFYVLEWKTIEVFPKKEFLYGKKMTNELNFGIFLVIFMDLINIKIFKFSYLIYGQVTDKYLGRQSNEISTSREKRHYYRENNGRKDSRIK